MTPFVESPPRSYRAFRIVYAFLALNFILPAISYIAAPEIALGTLDRYNRLLGGGPIVEAGSVWHMLAVGNVMTLGFMCGLLFADLRRFYPALPALVFLKGFSSLYSLAIAIAQKIPVFYGIFVLDGVTTLAMVVFAVRAYHDLVGGPRPPPVPFWSFFLFLRPRRIQRNLDVLRAARYVPAVPNLWQVFLGTLYMVHRLVFRPETVGTCKADPVRATWRARLLANRLARFPFLMLERVIAPLDFSGLGSSPDRVIRHLLGAHHDGAQFVYDLELLAFHPGKLDALCAAARHVVENDTPRTRWLRDLVVFERYHERLLAAAEAARAGRLEMSEEDRRSPDISLAGWLGWCARQPATPGATARALLRRELRFSPHAA